MFYLSREAAHSSENTFMSSLTVAPSLDLRVECALGVESDPICLNRYKDCIIVFHVLYCEIIVFPDSTITYTGYDTL